MKQTLGFTIRMPSVRCFDAQFAFNALGGVAMIREIRGYAEQNHSTTWARDNVGAR